MIIVANNDDIVERPPPAAKPPTLRLDLIGSDGSKWDLIDGPVGVLVSPKLFAAPTVTHWWQTSPTIDGSRHGGMRTPSRDITLPVTVDTEYAGDWQTWRDVDAAFFAAISPAAECTLVATTPDAQSRSINMRFVAGGDIEEGDPLLWLRTSYALEFVAANPFWRGEDELWTFGSDASVALFPGPPFTINVSGASQTSTVTNPGDEPVWPRHRITGPCTSWSVTIGTSVLSSTTAIASGKSLVIDTDPAELTVLDQDGNDVDVSGNRYYEQLTNDTFAPIPPGVDVNLKLSVSGFTTSSLFEVEFTPLYRRPW